ncbi:MULTISPECIES: Wzz/FepE/Etk N-terminal domain-containing protein [Vagococcus]|uniref:Capsular polysaccharide biosynthesis protein CpsC n=1 Tax=Vagococcus fluvialis bH819 TaxID=1255619 RepID=A0A1X6WLY6_9ENTE|nr:MULTISPECIES: Wzz/FepE/Etk N-terminal domain-containing protein [Vagococcus]SLM85252.1 Tyrosine-protein kinase transmembrane modulator EpsC [Vagococcus fluvialis bH819]HCM89450.1 tyrosine protein kinase [Vagococcus sp.]
MEETISLQEIFTLLKKNIVLILSMFFVGIGIAALVTFMLITPKYSATSQLIATSQNKDKNVSTDNINSNLMMINTYKDFIKGRVVTEETRKQLEKEIGFKGTATDIENMVNVTQTQNSQMFSIVVTSESPKEAATTANVIANIFREEAKEYTEADKVSIISEAEVPTSPVSPNKKINLAIGGLLGIILGIGLALLSQLFNRTVKNPEYLTETLQIPIVGILPLVDDKTVKEFRTQQWAALEETGSMSDNANDEVFDFQSEVDGLDDDLSKLNKNVNLEETIDLSNLDITTVDLESLDFDLSDDDEDNTPKPTASRATRRFVR